MRFADALLCTACVGLSAVAQVMLRAASQQAGRAAVPGPMAWVNGLTLAAVGVYLCGMVLWLWVLSRVPLTQAFAFFGLSFLVIPLLASWQLGDPVNANTWWGGAIIVAGILVSVWPAR